MYNNWGHYHPRAMKKEEKPDPIPEKVRQAALGLIDATHIDYDQKAKTYVVYGMHGDRIYRCFWDGVRFDSRWAADTIPDSAVRL